MSVPMDNCKVRWLISVRNWKAPIVTWRPVSKKTIASAERLRRILEGLPCGVLVIEAGARISTLNPEAARLLGGSFELVDALPAALSAALERARQTGEELELPLDLPASLPDTLSQSGLDQSSATALLDPRALSSAAPARTLSPQSCGALSAGNSFHDSGAVARSGAMKTSLAIRAGRWSLVVGRSVHWVRRDERGLESALNQ